MPFKTQSVDPMQVLMLGWMDIPSTPFDFMEVFSGKQALTRTMSHPQGHAQAMHVAGSADINVARCS